MKACSKIITLFILLAGGFSHHALAVVELEGEIVVDTVWSKSLSPYILTDDVIVLEDVTLTIEPGVVIQFNKTGSSDGFHLEVQGTLQARGMVDDPILFTIDDKEYHWGHIEFADTSIAWNAGDQSGCILEYCILEYGGNGRVEASERAAVRVLSSSPLIQDNVIRYSKNDGIRTVGGDQNITANRIHDTTTGIKIITPASATISNNYLTLNQQGIYLDSGDTNVEANSNTVLAASEEGHGAALGLNLGFHDTLSSYAWEQLTGTDVSLSDPESTTPEFTAPDVPAPEALVFQVTVTDESGLQAVDTVQVNVGWDNAPPLAIAGNDQTVDPGELVTLDGSESVDNDDGISSYEWLQTSGPDVGLTPHADPRFATFTAPTPSGDFGELLVFQITITDSGGLQDIDTVVVRVNSNVAVGVAPIADAGPDQPIYPDPIPVPPPTVNEGDTVTLDGSGSSDPDGTIVSYQWESLDTYIEFLTPPVSTDPTVQFVAPSDTDPLVYDRVYEFKLTVTDNDGNTSSDNVIVNVTDPTDPEPNDRPTADAGTDQGTLVEGTLVTLDGSASTDEEDLDGNPEFYYWEQIAGDIYPNLSGVNTDPSRDFTVPEDPQFFGPDEFVFRLTVEDERGLRHTDTTSIFISWTNDPPIAEAGNDQEVIEGEKVLLNGSGSSDPDDGIATYTWTQISGPAVDLSSSGAAKVWFIAPDVVSEEVLVFRLRVADSNPRNDNDVTHVSVKPATNGPTADAGSVDPVAFGATVDLSGTAIDPDNDIVSYLWEQTDGEPVTLLNATTLTPQFTAPSAAEDPFITLTFKLTVTDAENNTSMDTILINVRDDTQVSVAPAADAGPDQNVSIFDTVALNASASFDADAGPDLTVSQNYFAYNLEIVEPSDSDDEIEPGNLVALSSESEANSQLVFSDNNLLNLDGNYSLYLFSWQQAAIDTVNLSGNWWGTTSVSEIGNSIFDNTFDPALPVVTVANAAAQVGATGSNLSYPAIADADANDDDDQDDIAKDPDEVATLSCKGYNHPNQTFSYTWEQKQGKSVNLTNADQCNATFIVPEVSSEDQDGDDLRTLIFELTVTDAQGFYDNDEVQVTINEIDEDDDDTHSTTGCFVSTLGKS